MAEMDAQAPTGLQIARRAAQQVPIRPDPSHPVDRMTGERNGEAGGIGIGRRPGLALAPGRFAMLLEVGRPDDRARRPHPPDMARDRLAVARCGDLQLVEPRALALGAADDRAVDLPSGQRTERAAQRPADQRADGAEDQGCHRDLLQWKLPGAQDRRAGAGFGERGCRTTRRSPAWAWTIVSGPTAIAR